MGQAPPALTHVHTNTGIGRCFQSWYFRYLTTCFQSTPETASQCAGPFPLTPPLLPWVSRRAAVACCAAKQAGFFPLLADHPPLPCHTEDGGTVSDE